MTSCDVLVVGGGPAGSTCARALKQAGVDVTVIDRATFPREKPCAGWITPGVLPLLQLDPQGYQSQHTLQPITGFRVGLIGRRAAEVTFAGVVSYGIARAELDEHLLRRSGAAVLEGTAVTSLRRTAGRWIVNEAISAPLLVGAGGHFCPVARLAGRSMARVDAIVARQMELRLTATEAAACPAPAERPELRFCHDLRGYGWVLRKGNLLNIGLGRDDVHHLARHVEAFVRSLDPALQSVARRGRWRGHAYLLRGDGSRRPIAEGVLLVGDAAGLAVARSGEGIGPAVESGLLAADAIVATGDLGDCTRRRYEDTLNARFPQRLHRWFGSWLPESVLAAAVDVMFCSDWLTRRVVVDGWFLHGGQPVR